MTDKVLLVDDEAEFTEVLAERMTTRGLRVDVADSGHAALDRAREVFYDAVILDLMMPGIDGLETLKRLLEINADLQVILLTGHATLPVFTSAGPWKLQSVHNTPTCTVSDLPEPPKNSQIAPATARTPTT